MAEFNTQDAGTALNLLADIALEREEDISNFNTSRDQNDSDEESDSSCPYFDKFFEEGGTQAISDMCNFNASEFEFLWQLLESFVLQNYNSGRGKKCHVTGKDMLFMLLTVMKHGGHWDILGRVFKIKGPTFERMITKFIRLVSDHIYKIFVTDMVSESTMSDFNATGKRFSNFPEALYAVDVTFQQSFRPSGSIQEGKLYFSGKHKLYGLKVEVAVLPNGLAISCSPHYPGSVSDFEIVQRQRELHEKLLKKKESDRSIMDVGMHSERYPQDWAVLCDKGYQGLLELLRAIHPIKKPPRGALSVSDEMFNRKVSSDRIIVENYFGRLCGLWTLFSSKWRWNEGLYDDFFRAAIGLTNLHIKSNPLRQEDVEKLAQFRNRLAHIANQAIENRKRVLARYQEKRRRNVNQQFRRSQFSGHRTE